FFPANPPRKSAPAPAGAAHPQEPIEDPSFVGARPPLPLPPARQNLLKPLPLVIPKRIAVHRRSPKISVESDSRPLENPRSLNRHRGLAGLGTSGGPRVLPLMAR